MCQIGELTQKKCYRREYRCLPRNVTEGWYDARSFRGRMKEYIEALKERYLKASRKEKGQILDEVKRVTG